jgi:hypothetical protein
MNVDDALALWADAVRLSPAAADDIYFRVVTDEPDTRRESRFWRKFSADFATTMVASTRTAAWAA